MKNTEVHGVNPIKFQGNHGVLNKTYDQSLIKYLPADVMLETLKMAVKVVTKARDFMAYGEYVFEIVNRKISRKRVQNRTKRGP